ncbi:MAG: hypothetical protein WC606_05635 [Candidatus Absconditabacterales bacterium]|jgi:hypothetical protein
MFKEIKEEDIQNGMFLLIKKKIQLDTLYPFCFIAVYVQQIGYKIVLQIISKSLFCEDVEKLEKIELLPKFEGYNITAENRDTLLGIWAIPSDYMKNIANEQLLIWEEKMETKDTAKTKKAKTDLEDFKKGFGTLLKLPA